MKNNIVTVSTWYAGNADADKYVTCMSAMLEQIHRSGASVACKWLEVTANLDIRTRWSKRRKYWLLTVKLFYAEWVGSEVLISRILTKASSLVAIENDEHAKKMYQVLEVACYVSLYRISKGKISPLFKNYHRQLLGIVDDLITLQLNNHLSGKSFLEDYGRVFDVVSDIEKICGGMLFNKPVENSIDREADNRKTANKETNILIFKQKEDTKIDNIIIYLNQWLGNRYNDKKNPLMRVFLRSLEYAKNTVDTNLGLSTSIIFIKDKENKRVLNNINNAQHYMLEELNNKSLIHDKTSFWKIYIELVLQKAIKNMGEFRFNQLNNSLANDLVLKQAARWPLHEKMHYIIRRLAGDSSYLENLLEKKIIHSESLLYGIFSTLAMQNIPVLYSGFNIINNNLHQFQLKPHCYNGKGLERIYAGLIELIYKTIHDSPYKGFCLSFSHDTGYNSSMEKACICTDNQIIIVGISKKFSLNDKTYQSSREILAELFCLVGFDFSYHQLLNIKGPVTPETSVKKFKTIKPKETHIKKENGFILNYINNHHQSNDSEYLSKFSNIEKFNKDYFDEIIKVVQNVH